MPFVKVAVTVTFVKSATFNPVIKLSNVKHSSFRITKQTTIMPGFLGVLHVKCSYRKSKKLAWTSIDTWICEIVMIVASWFLRQKKSRAGNSQKKTKKTGMNVHSTAEIQMIIALWFLRKEKNTGVEIRITEIRIVSASPQNKKENFFKFQTRKLSPYYIVKILPYWKSCFSIRNLNFAWSLIFLCYKRVSNL